jgi:hypothetical protein
VSVVSSLNFRRVQTSALLLQLHFSTPTSRFDMSELSPKPPNHESKPQVFTKFPDLPPEIRQEIWKYLLPGSRIIHIKMCARADGGQCFADMTENPLLLRVCQESRHFALERYQLSFEPHLRHPIYFDFSSDILYMWCEKVSSLFFERSEGSITSEVTRVKVIAIGVPPTFPNHVVSKLLSFMRMAFRLMDATTRFGNLQEIILMSPGSQTDPDLESYLCSEKFQTKLRICSRNNDSYVLKRREFLDYEARSTPIISHLTAVDFWKRFP